MACSLPLLLTLLTAAPGWRTDILSDDPQVRSEALTHLHAKGRPGLYAVQDVVQHSTDDLERARAVRALGELGDPTAEWELRLELRQTSPHVLTAVVQAIDQLHLNGLARPMSEKVGDPDPELCASFAAALKSFPEIAESARSALASEDAERQLAGLRVLAGAGLPVDPAVARKLTGSRQPEARLSAALALGASDPEAAVAVLAELWTGPQEPAVIAALGRLATPRALELLVGLFDSPNGQSARATSALAALASSAAGERVLLKRRSAPTLTIAQRTAIDAALDGQPRTPELLVALLGDPDDSLAFAAAAMLGERPAGVAAMARCLENLDPNARRCAAGLASSGRSANEVGHALQAFDPEVRTQMLAAMAAAVRAPKLDVLVPLAVDPSEEVRVKLAAVLARLETAGLPLLLKLAGDPQAAVRAAAAGQLVGLLPNDQLHQLASEAVYDSAVRSAVLPWAARFSTEDAIRLLLADLHVSDVRERRQALAMLASYRAPDAVNALLDSAAKDADPTLREYALSLISSQ